MKLHDAAGKGQADAASFFLGGIEGGEYIIQPVVGDAFSVVGYLQEEGAGCLDSFDFYFGIRIVSRSL